MREDVNIRIVGVRATINALRDFTPSVEAALHSTIIDVLNRVRHGAQARYPRGSWIVGRNRKKLLGYVAARAGGGGWGRTGGPWRGLRQLAPGTRAAVLEFIGSKYAGNRPQVVGLLRTLDSRYGSPGRFLWASWDEHGKGVLRDIADAVRVAERDLQATLDAAGEAY